LMAAQAFFYNAIFFTYALILTDFYDSGDVIGAARELNGLGNELPAAIDPLER